MRAAAEGEAMSTALIIGAALLVGMGLVASQLFRLKDWLNRQPLPDPDGESIPGPDEPSPPNQLGAP
jgi:hypothetical protein